MLFAKARIIIAISRTQDSILYKIKKVFSTISVCHLTDLNRLKKKIIFTLKDGPKPYVETIM